ncbi:MAG: lasso peptide biosynthesis B2 protein [Nitrospirae bacterium]|nr:lasso peptide biosynthesis B2 protein [Nitrospirota bacterium]
MWLRNLRRLSPPEAMILAQAWVLLILAELGLRLLPFHSLLSLRRGFQRASQDSLPPPPLFIARLAWLVEVAGRYSVIKATCLKQALVLSWLLERRGLSTLLRIGVSRRAGALKAHAWLELDGQVILGLPVHEQYEPLFET